MTTPCYSYTVFDFKVHNPTTDGEIYYDRHLVPAHSTDEAIEKLEASGLTIQGRMFVNTQWAVEAVNPVHPAVHTLRDKPLSQHELTLWIASRCYPYKDDGVEYPAAFVEIER